MCYSTNLTLSIMRKYKLLLFIASFFLSLSITAQNQPPVQFYFEKIQNGPGEFILKIKGVTAKGVQIFSIQKVSDDLPVNTSIHFDSASLQYITDSIIEKGIPTTAPNSSLDNMEVSFFKDSVSWLQKIKLSSGDSIRIKGKIIYYYQKGDRIESGEAPISMQFQYQNKVPAELVANSTGSLQAKSMWALLLAGIVAGLIGFLTPCVYALVPITISFFTKKSKTKLQGKKMHCFILFRLL